MSRLSTLPLNAIEKAQMKIESNNFAIRKNLLEYDQVNNEQREIIYSERRRVLNGESMRDSIFKMITDIVDNAVDLCFGENTDKENWDANELNSVLLPTIPLQPVTQEECSSKAGSKNELKQTYRRSRPVKLYELKEAEFPEQEQIREAGACHSSESHSTGSGWITSTIWISCVRVSDCRAYGQRDPLVEYKISAYEMFDAMSAGIQEDTVRLLFHVKVEQKVEREEVAKVTGTKSGMSPARERRRSVPSRRFLRTIRVRAEAVKSTSSAAAERPEAYFIAPVDLLHG